VTFDAQAFEKWLLTRRLLKSGFCKVIETKDRLLQSVAHHTCHGFRHPGWFDTKASAENAYGLPVLHHVHGLLNA